MVLTAPLPGLRAQNGKDIPFHLPRTPLPTWQHSYMLDRS